MIRNKLSDLLGERQIKISKLSLQTKIARSTLTPIYYNQSEMIKIETINKICKALKVDVNEFFEYVDFDFNFSHDKDSQKTKLFMRSDSQNIRQYNLDLAYICKIEKNNTFDLIDLNFKTTDTSDINDIIFWIDLSETEGKWESLKSTINYTVSFNNSADKEIFYSYYNQLSVGMKLVLQNETKSVIRHFLVDFFKDDISNQHSDIPKLPFVDIINAAEINITF